MLGRTRRIHFIGVGGSGMSGIAELLANLGYMVTGSDERRSATTDRLAALGVKVDIGHATQHVGGADVVVMSSAVRPGNPEVVEAQKRGVPVIPRAEMLAELMRLRYSIAVAGAHGKTTTTSMIALAVERAGLDPTVVIGGRLSAFGSNARLGRGELMVAEADESDRSFLKLFPTVAVITNIDYEHLENYGSFDELCEAFVEFANKVPFYGAVVCCADDPHLRAIAGRMTRRVITYGMSESADVTASDIELGPLSATAVIKRRARRSDDPAKTLATLGRLELNVPGHHNLLNALAAVAVGLELAMPFERIAPGLQEFRGAERRFEVKGEPRGILVVDDYGHHPTEIAAVLAAAHTLKRRIIVAFQPHRYSRTRALFDAFGPSLASAHHVILTDIYPAGEDPIPGVTLQSFADRVRSQITAPVEVVPTLADVAPALARVAEAGDVVITLGAGSIATVPEQLLALLDRRAGPSRRTGAEA
ncbi:MAG TPA: UDP-N-acetylmuramate--L-alanine ligase [Vicinamibacterales bacterium]|nr:UDP-N-acetylmuramate--L-alanine ligase [Vicinamibacterales bacterium]